MAGASSSFEFRVLFFVAGLATVQATMVLSSHVWYEETQA